MLYAPPAASARDGLLERTACMRQAGWNGTDNNIRSKRIPSAQRRFSAFAPPATAVHRTRTRSSASWIQMAEARSRGRVPPLCCVTATCSAHQAMHSARPAFGLWASGIRRTHKRSRSLTTLGSRRASIGCHCVWLGRCNGMAAEFITNTMDRCTRLFECIARARPGGAELDSAVDCERFSAAIVTRPEIEWLLRSRFDSWHATCNLQHATDNRQPTTCH